MINGLFDQPNYLAVKKLLDASTLRQQAIASNLANLETPNYKRVDIDASFSAQLRQAIAGGNTSQLQALQPKVTLDPTAVSANRDGNTVQLEHELMQLSQNTLEHGFETQLVSASLLRLRLAITGRAS